MFDRSLSFNLLDFCLLYVVDTDICHPSPCNVNDICHQIGVHYECLQGLIMNFFFTNI